nr:hypothetical protein [Anaerolineae bacterium]
MAQFPYAERGQALIFIVFAMVALLVIAGLAIDGGTVFLERRRMQNAADAAALAGTRLLAEAICGEPEADDAAIAAEVNHYAEINGVKAPDNNVVADYVDFEERVLGHVGDGTIPTGATGISATVEISRPTYFVTLVGIDTAGASAYALAMTGPPLMAGGILPMITDVDLVENRAPGEEFRIIFANCQHQEPCYIVDPDTGDPIAQHRGWLNLDYIYNAAETPDFPRVVSKNPSNAKVRSWVRNGADVILYAGSVGGDDGDFVHAIPGERTSAIKEAESHRIGDLVYIPLFDVIRDKDYMATHFEEPSIGWATAGGGWYYHVVGFVGFRITETDYHGPQKYIQGELVETIIGEGMLNPSEGYQSGGGSSACKTHTMVVTLWR